MHFTPVGVIQERCHGAAVICWDLLGDVPAMCNG